MQAVVPAIGNRYPCRSLLMLGVCSQNSGRWAEQHDHKGPKSKNQAKARRQNLEPPAPINQRSSTKGFGSKLRLAQGLPDFSHCLSDGLVCLGSHDEPQKAWFE